MMDEKLKKIARKLSARYKTTGLDSIYRKFMKDVTDNEDYFSLYKTQDLVKILLYCYSFIRTNDFKLGDHMIDNSWVGNLFEFEKDNFANETCNDCGGDGYVNCDTCDGNGETECDECDGSGQVTCEACDGSGEDDEGDECSECRGNGEVDCDECDSTGRVSCHECGGNGSENCHECGGNGEVESDELLYMNTSFITWDKELINSFKNSLELRKPTSIQELAVYYDEGKILYIDENESSQEFSTDVEPDKFYCFNLETLNDSYLTLKKHKKSIWTAESPDDYTP